ncbi:hypothetical protein OSB04_016037 [Centaurea solstitialis]|uniref:Pseudouridine synthase RsuA/RluA-like domain-containing protein n=1 Tax=Centaurea solstitialis TaxID=347529 RepID=A0AA38W830_9ASTR|nr:hypothetical protein OSB04_016037 [Centaurea solstitialis]
MAVLSHLRRALLRSPPPATTVCGGARLLTSSYHHLQAKSYSTKVEDEKKENKNGKWLTLPPFKLTVNGASLGREIAGRRKSTDEGDESMTTTTAIKWVMRCCPQLPRSLVQKLFRLRQVRREASEGSTSDKDVQATGSRIKRVSAKDAMKCGDTIYLPITVQALPAEKVECDCSEEELKFLHDLVLYKDSAILVINKPPGMPVQGGIGIRTSLDDLAGTYLRHDFSEPPRLLSATVLHSVFREKTIGASNIDLKSEKRFLQRKYWALVLGSPRRPQGLISVPLGKVVMDDGRSERITVVENVSTMSSQHAITEYRVLESSNHGLTWLELSPLTGRKHQIRVHCAEVLGTPIVGDYKYGWQAHKKWNPLISSNLEEKVEISKRKSFPFGLDLEGGSISDKQPSLHLHCKKMVLPDVSSALERARVSSSDYDFGDIKSLKFGAPLPPHMQRSWDILSS